MSWLDKIKTDLTITTGDGKVFVPNWLNAAKTVEYNTTEFDFPNIEGTFADRREVRGAKYAIELYFQGEDHLDQASNFEISAKDKRAWSLVHPFYGSILVQPTSLTFDNRQYNTTKITGTLIETISDVNPKAELILEDKIEEDVEISNETAAVSFENDIIPNSTDINLMRDTNNVIYANVKQNIISVIDGEAYFNAFREADNAITNATSEAGATMRAIQAFILAPALFTQSVESRLNMLLQTFNTLRKNVNVDLFYLPISERVIYENQASATLNAMCISIVNTFDDEDYNNRGQVTDVMEFILERYQGFLADLDYMQQGTGGNPTDYIPNAQNIIYVNNNINFTIANLFQIGLNARQERVIQLDDDSDWITLTHRLYGISIDDSSIDELMRNNNLGLNGILGIPKGTEIRYYI